MTSLSFEEIFQDGLLIDLTIGYWSARRTNTIEDLGLTDKTLPDFIITLGSKQLIPKDIVLEWQRLESEARSLLTRYSFRFPIATAKFVPKRALATIEHQLTDIQQRFNTSVQTFYTNYPEIRRTMLDRYPEHRFSLEGAYPSLQALKQRFRFSWVVFSISIPRTLTITPLARDKFHEEQQALTAYRQQLNVQMDEFLNEVIGSLRTETVELCTRIAAKIVNGDVITETTLQSLRQFTERFELLNFVGDQTISDALTTLRATWLSKPATEYRSNSEVRDALTTTLHQIRDAAAQFTDYSQVSGQYRRRITKAPIADATISV